MNLIIRVLSWLCGRGDRRRGEPLVDEIVELYEERRIRRGVSIALGRAFVDVATLVVRPRRRSAESPQSGSAFPADLRDAWRSIVRRPVVGLAAFTAITLGMGLTGVTMVVVRGVLLNPLPFPDGDRLVTIYGEFLPESGYEIPRMALSWPEFLDYTRETRSVDAGAYLPTAVNLARPGDESERVPAALMSASMFGVLGVRPLLGQWLQEAHDEPGGPAGSS